MACAAMELYTNSFRELLNHFPKQVIASPEKKSGYTNRSSYHAITECRFIRYNSDARINIIAIDIDHHQDGGVWLDHNLPQPTWTIWTDRGVQLAWVLRTPIPVEINPKAIAYAEDMQRRIAYALDADTGALGLVRIFRNPATNPSFITDSRVDLRDFDHLDRPPVGWGERRDERATPTLFNRKTVDVADFSTMKEGDGRNDALFDRLRYWAYDEADNGSYDEFDLATRAFKLNEQFAEPMGYKEVDDIIASIDRFIRNKYKRGGKYMKRTTPEERKEIAIKNGKKGGAVTAKVRSTEARGRILAALNRLEMFELKITIAGVAKMAKSHKSTVSEYLKELGYSNKGGSEGWKR